MSYTKIIKKECEFETAQGITSLEVTEMVGKDHSKLLQDIRNYIEQLNQSKIGFVDFFTESIYKDGKGEITSVAVVKLFAYKYFDVIDHHMQLYKL